ncbi:MAG TPA: tRNA (guanosine(37)-N1)-methyltransferase TrmD [Vampirovibrionales bacterium]
MRFDVITLFPETIKAYCSESILGRALKENHIELHTTNLRDFGLGKHLRVDDVIYGGGVGMLLRPEPIFEAHASIPKLEKNKTILLTPRGQLFSQPVIRKQLTPPNVEQLIFICGRYEGVDERVMTLVDLPISLGDYILTGGELGAMVVIDAVSRLVEGVLPKGESVHGFDSFSDEEGNVLEAPQYTRPAEFNGLKVPEVLTNGNHQEIAKWKEENAKRLN